MLNVYKVGLRSVAGRNEKNLNLRKSLNIDRNKIYWRMNNELSLYSINENKEFISKVNEKN